MRSAITIFLFVALVSAIACARLTTTAPPLAKTPSPGVAEAKEAIRDLRKLQAAVKIGTNQLNYDPLLIQAKATCDEAERKLPAGRLKIEIDEAIRAYVDASELWSNWKDIYPNNPPYDGWKTKYGIKSHEKRYREPMPMTVVSFDPQESVPVIWAYAEKHLEEAGRLLDAIE